MTSIEIEIEDYLHEVDTDTLRRELKSREMDAQPGDDPNGPHYWTPIGLVTDLRTAFYAPNAARFEMLLAVLESGGDPMPGLKYEPVAA